MEARILGSLSEAPLVDPLGRASMLDRPSRSEIRDLLRRGGLRPTRQRMELAEVLYARGHRHVSAESLYEEVTAQGIDVSLATIYNTLHQFTGAGFLREVTVDGSKVYFDTNVSDHHHFFIEDDARIMDVPDKQLVLGQLPDPPPGYAISRIDVVIRLRRLPDSTASREP